MRAVCVMRVMRVVRVVRMGDRLDRLADAPLSWTHDGGMASIACVHVISPKQMIESARCLRPAVVQVR